MVSLRKHKKAQSTLEYAILIVVVIMALIAGQAILKRGIQGRLKQSADDIGQQYSAEFTESNYTTTTHAEINEEQNAWTTTTTYDNQWTQRIGNETMGNFQEEFWMPQ